MSEVPKPEAITPPRIDPEELATIFARGSLASQLAAQRRLLEAFTDIPPDQQFAQQGQAIEDTIRSLESRLNGNDTESPALPEVNLDNPYVPFEVIAGSIAQGAYDEALPEVVGALKSLATQASRRLEQTDPTARQATAEIRELPGDFAEQFIVFVDQHPGCNIQSILYALLGTRRVEETLFDAIHKVDHDLREQGLIYKNPNTKRYYPLQPNTPTTPEQPRTATIDEKLKAAGLFGTSTHRAPSSSLNNTTSRRGGHHNR